MKKYMHKLITIITPIILIFSIISCDEKTKTPEINLSNKQDQNENLIQVSSLQFEKSKMKLDSFKTKEFLEYINAFGKLNIPPKNKASITPLIGGYVKFINLLE